MNIGCGINKYDGYVNIDSVDLYLPDLLMNAEVVPWPFEESSIDEIMFNHSLEHMGGDNEVFFSLICELYRVCANGAIVQINVPHPRHDNFINDPTHVRIVTPELLSLFSKKNNLTWRETGAPNTQLALRLNVDFDILHVDVTPDEKYTKLIGDGFYGADEIFDLSRKYNNVISEYKIVLKVNK